MSQATQDALVMPIVEAPPPRYRLGFRPDIEGLRAVAVVAVLFFHASVPGFTGGYIGVDVFFVISGFLITSLLLGDIEERGKFSIKEFYARRARRILPAAGVVLAVTSVVSMFMLTPLRRQDLAADVTSAALNFANWHFIGLQTDYLAQGRAESPLLHYWSLAVEEQFYLVWAPLTLMLALLARRLRRSPISTIAVAVAVLTAGSFSVSVYWTTTNSSLAYLGTPSRAWQFGVGALGAIAVPLLVRMHRHVGLGLGLAGAAAISLSIYAFSRDTAFPGTAALLPTLGALAIMLGRGTTGVSWLLATAPARAAGRLSYSWYLWHWPVVILWEAKFGEQPWPVKLVLVLASGIPAWFTMRLVENPLRLSKRITKRAWRGLAAGLASVVVAVGCGVALNVSAGNAVAQEADWPFRPTPLQARHDSPIASKPCQARGEVTTNGPCLYGDPASHNRVVLFGDSHALQWFPALHEIVLARGWSLEVLGKSGCPVPAVKVVDRTNPKADEYCVEWRDRTVERILKGPKPKFIMVGTLMRRVSVGPTYIDAWDQTLTRLAASGSPVVYLRDTPYPGRDIPECVSGFPPGEDNCGFPRNRAILPDVMADLISEGRRPGVHVIDFNGILCPQVTCAVVIGEFLAYHDESHISATYAQALAPEMDKQLVAAGLA